MITRALAHQAVDDGLLEAIKDHVKIGVTTILSESNDENARQFELGIRKLRDAGIIQHAIVEKTFPE
jgi:rhamnogalacturonyl hydrolase YesR